MSSHPAPTEKFLSWLWKDRENRRLLILAGISIVIHFTWIKILYPYPNFMPPDSYSYIDAASRNLNVNLWPIGYSKFLRLLSCFSNNHLALVILQYSLLQGSIIYLLFSIRYFMRPENWIFITTLLLSICNPLIGHISNFVSSDALFTALSICWFSQLMWLLLNPSNKQLWLHSIVILLSVMVRHNALYYPFISAGILLFTYLPYKEGLKGFLIIGLPLFFFIGFSQYYYKKDTDKIQYSAFAGWQIAANALYGYAYADLDSPKSLPLQFRQLHKVVNRHMDSIRSLKNRPDNDVSIYYLWNDRSPLKLYMQEKWKNDNTANGFKRWAAMGPLYGKYGRYMIAHHPSQFARHYLWPNFINYYIPPTKFMGMYNLEKPIVEPGAVRWFGWKDNKVNTYYKNLKIDFIEYFSIIIAMVNVFYLTVFICFIVLKGLKKSFSVDAGIWWWVTLIWFSNMCFSVFSAPIEMRYQIFPMVITLAMAVNLIDLILKSGKIK